MKLSNKELKQTPFVTLGRLGAAIEAGNVSRATALYKKVCKDMSELDIQVMKLDRQCWELGSEIERLKSE